jgi:hypothetical protein
MTPQSLVLALEDLPKLELKQLASFSVFRASAGVSPWERYPDDDEFLDSEVEITLVTPERWRTAVVAVPRGLWHRHTIKERLVELFVTPVPACTRRQPIPPRHHDQLR